MFESLTDKFTDVFRKMSGRGRISEQNVKDAMRDVRQALLEADVHYKVVRQFCDDVVAKALGTEVIKSLHPGQLMVKIVQDELINLMGPVDTRIYYVTPPPTVIMMAGLQGSGKTTTCGKLAHFIMRQGKHPLLVACDLQRPAAVDQLTVVADQVGVPCFRMDGEKNPVKVARQGVQQAVSMGRDVVIIDTAGRLHVDEEMMKQAADIAQAVHPHQIYLVCDSMTGQDAVNSAKEFNERLELDGVILTKFDGDARGGAAISVKAVTGKPIKFIGVGEKLENLEEFHPDRMASRILGMGDIVTLVEKAQGQFDAEQAAKMQEKMAKGQFTLTDFLAQMKQMRKLGPLKEILKLMPGMGQQVEAMQMDGDEITRMEAVINSMTVAEREDPTVIEANRRRRIAKGSGTEPEDVSGLVKSFSMAAGMMKQMAGMGTKDRMRFAQQMGQAGMAGMTPRFKVKQRSHRLTKKERDKKNKQKKKGRR
ncbi:MAG: signal recognition particle protein [Planctomycetes bacterium]|mgnify:CR=1 FL=1|jgi:signal recognition particle subunit SRP54|nr:signal recognition particle protein [Planctomycetota bacterium]